MPEIAELISNIRKSGLPKAKQDELMKRLLKEGPSREFERVISDAVVEHMVAPKGIYALAEKVNNAPKKAQGWLVIFAIALMFVPLFYLAMPKRKPAADPSPPIVERPFVSTIKTASSPGPIPQPPAKTPTATPPRTTARPAARPTTGGIHLGGGSLHNKTIREWKGASYANKLATCEDFILGLRAQNKLRISVITSHAVRHYASELVKAIDTAVEGLDFVDKETVAYLAASCMMIGGWLK